MGICISPSLPICLAKIKYVELGIKVIRPSMSVIKRMRGKVSPLSSYYIIDTKFLNIPDPFFLKHQIP